MGFHQSCLMNYNFRFGRKGGKAEGKEEESSVRHSQRRFLLVKDIARFVFFPQTRSGVRMG